MQRLRRRGEPFMSFDEPAGFAWLCIGEPSGSRTRDNLIKSGVYVSLSIIFKTHYWLLYIP